MHALELVKKFKTLVKALTIILSAKSLDGTL